MRIAMVGLGTMGANMAALRNRFGGHPVTLESGQAGLETSTPRN